MTEPRLELRGVSKRFGDFTALVPLDLTVWQGEFIALLGPAGSGKTTTLRLIAGLDRTTAGAVLIDGLEVTPLPPQRRDVAFAFQHPALYPHLRVWENIAYPMRAQSMPRNQIDRRVNEVIGRLGLDAIRKRKPRALSASQQQLVSLGRAMVRDCKAFLFDEPVATFTGKQRDRMRRELRAVHEELRGTTILATRDPLDAIVTADRIVVMNQGRVVQVGAPQEVYDHPADLFVAHYLGAHAMNFLDASLADGSVRLACGGASFRVDPSGAQPVDPTCLMLGIRPEHVRIDRGGIRAVVGGIEPRDDERIVSLRVGDHTSVRTTVPANQCPAEGETVSFRFNLAGCRWYDATSGKALPWQTTGDLYEQRSAT
jgi:multiple sugar transport system ATP-binding protein